MDPNCGGIDVGTLWQVIYWTIAIFIMAIIPFTIFITKIMNMKQALTKKELLETNKRCFMLSNDCNYFLSGILVCDVRYN